MFRRSGISARLNLLIVLVATTVLGLIGVGFLAVNGQTATQQQLLSLSAASSAAQRVQYDFADFVRWQSAYSFDVTRTGIATADATAASRSVFLKSVATARGDLTVLKQRSAGVAEVDPKSVAAVSDGLDTFM